MAQLTRRESVRNDATRRQGSCTKASRAAKPAPSAQAACVDNPAAAQAACARPSRRRRDSVSRARPPAVRAAVAAVLALALGAFGCAPAGSAGKAPEVQASDRSYVEERVPLPEGLPFVADLAIERNIGARGLRAVMEGILTRIMYDIPSDQTIEQVTITADCVKNGAEPVIRRNPDRAVHRARVKGTHTEGTGAPTAPAS